MSQLAWKMLHKIFHLREREKDSKSKNAAQLFNKDLVASTVHSSVED